MPPATAIRFRHGIGREGDHGGCHERGEAGWRGRVGERAGTGSPGGRMGTSKGEFVASAPRRSQSARIVIKEFAR